MKTIKNVMMILVAVAISYSYTTKAQVAINTDGSNPDSSAGLDVKFADKGFLPPRMTITQRDSMSSPMTGLIIINTTTHLPNYYNGSIWMHFDNTPAPISIGDYYLGGVIFYLDGSGGGLVCAVSDQDGGSGIHWYNGIYTFIETTHLLIGTGQANTTAIIDSQGPGSYAATVCDNYTVDVYSDWFLPSYYELNEMYLNKEAINATATENGGNAFVSAPYWSSTETDLHYAFLDIFNNGELLMANKNGLYRVRAVRAFSRIYPVE